MPTSALEHRQQCTGLRGRLSLFVGSRLESQVETEVWSKKTNTLIAFYLVLTLLLAQRQHAALFRRVHGSAPKCGRGARELRASADGCTYLQAHAVAVAWE